MTLFCRRYRPKHSRRQGWLAGTFQWFIFAALLPLHLAALVFAIGWDDVVNLFGGAVDIAQRIRDIVQDAIGIVWNWISRAFDWATNWLQNLQDWTGWATNWFTGRINGIYDWLVTLDDWARHALLAWVVQLVQEAKNLALGVLDTARGEFNNLYHSALGAVDNLMQWTINYVFSPLAGLINNTINDLHNLIGWVPARIAEVLAWTEQRIWDVVHAVTDPVFGIIDFVRNDVLPLWDKVVGWLEFFANHPFDWFTQLLRSYVDRGSRQLTQMMLDAATRNMDIVEEQVAKWLAS